MPAPLGTGNFVPFKRPILFGLLFPLVAMFAMMGASKRPT